MKTFPNVLHPTLNEVFKVDYKLKGRWKQDFFQHDNPLVLELGCGKGEYTVGLARKYPGKNFLGVDIKGARMWRGAKTALEEKLKNVGFLRTRIDFIACIFGPGEVQEIWVTFPDPQPKKALKRLTSSRFLGHYQKIIAEDTVVHLKTDNRLLYDYTLALVNTNQLQVLAQTSNLYQENGLDEVKSIQTFYEQQFLEEGKNIHYLRFKLFKNKPLEEPEFEEQEFFSKSL